MSREFWIRDGHKEFGVPEYIEGLTAFKSPEGVKGKDSQDCELIHVREILPNEVDEIKRLKDALEKAKECLNTIKEWDQSPGDIEGYGKAPISNKCYEALTSINQVLNKE